MKGIILKVLSVVTVVCFIICATVFCFNKFYKIDVEVSGGKLLSASPSEVVKELEQAIEEVKFILETPETENQYSFEEVGLSLTLDVDELKRKINSKTFFKSVDCTELLTLSIHDDEKMMGILESLNENSEKSKDAKLKRGKSWFKLSDERYGNEVEVDLLMERLEENVKDADILFGIIDSAVLKFTVTDEDYIKPGILSSDYNELLDELSKYETWHISYTNGFHIGNKELYPYLSVDVNGKVMFNEKKFRKENFPNFNQELLSYTTVGIERNYVDHSGKKAKISGGTYGDRINYTEEFEFIVKSIKKGRSYEGRTPIMEMDLPDKIGNTYIEVNISGQHLWYYVKGKLKMETDIVTGRAGKHDTPKGLYYISERIPGKYLVGDDYKTWVNYWMRLTNTGVGLHDAYWRKKFGGNVYKYNGSHGCINLPKDFAKTLYEIVETRTPVIVN